MNKTNKTLAQKYKEFNVNTRTDEILMQLTLLFVRSGYYNHSSGNRNDRDSNGNYWEHRVSSSAYARILRFNSTRFYLQDSSYKGDSFSLRCVAKLFCRNFFRRSCFDYFSGTSQLSSGDASDSICPKGWGIARYSGDGSYQKLIADNYGINRANIVFKLNYKEYDIFRTDDFILQFIFSFARLGYYKYDSGVFTQRNNISYFWENKVNYYSTAFDLNFYSERLNPRGVDNQNSGFSVRWGGK